MRERYLSKEVPLLAESLPYHSCTWHRMGSVRQKVEQNIFWSIGEGKILFLHDNWLESGWLWNYCTSYSLNVELKYGNFGKRIMELGCYLSSLAFAYCGGNFEKPINHLENDLPS